MKWGWVGDLQELWDPGFQTILSKIPVGPLCCFVQIVAFSRGTLLLCPVTFSGTRAHEVPRQGHLAPTLSLDLNPTYRFESLSLSLLFSVLSEEDAFISYPSFLCVLSTEQTVGKRS